MCRLAIFLAAVLLVAVAALGGRPITPVSAAACPVAGIVVNTTADTVATTPATSPNDAGGNISLRSAVMFANASAGPHTICLGANTYTLTIPPSGGDGDNTGDLNVTTNDLTVLGVSSASTIVQAGTVKSTNGTDGNGIDRVFALVSANLTLQDMTVRFGKATFSGGVDNASTTKTLTLTNMVLTDNYASQSGGAVDALGPVTMTGSTVSNNIAGTGGGGGMLLRVSNTISTSTISGNTTGALGGGLAVGSPGTTTTLSNTTISTNKATNAGGGVYNSGSGTLTVSNSTISSNTTDSAGAGIFDSSGPLTITNSTISSNTSNQSFGGGVYLNVGGLTISGSTISNNTALEGGALDVGLNVNSSITNSTITGNVAQAVTIPAGSGGGIFAIGVFTPALLTITNTSIDNNKALGSPINTCVFACGIGGGITADLPTAITGGSLSGNTAKGGGGGISAGATTGVAPGGIGVVTLDGVTIANNNGNSDGDTFGDGGGVLMVAATTNVGLTSPVTITGNTAYNGGGIGATINAGATFPTPRGTIQQVTLSNNTATKNGGGLSTVIPSGVSTLVSSVGPAGAGTLISPVPALLSGRGSDQSFQVTGRDLLQRSADSVTVSPVTAATLQVTKSTITGNTATDAGGGIYHDGGSAALLPLTANFNRIVNNTAASATGAAQVNGSVDVTRNWWGCNGGPNTTGCGTTSGTLNFTPWLRYTLTAAPATVQPNSPSTLTASFLTDSNNGAVAPSNLTTEIGLPIAFIATNGAISNAQTTIQSSGTATATDTVAGCPVSTATATVDNGTASATVTCVAPPVLSKAFNPPPLSKGQIGAPLNTPIPLSFTLQNPNPAQALSGVSFTDTLPAGMVVATPNSLSGNCGGTVSALAGSGVISLTGASLASGAGCSFTVNIVATVVGSLVNTTSAPTSVEGGAGLPATATLNVGIFGGGGSTPSGPTAKLAPVLSKSFSGPQLFQGGSATVIFTLNNPNTTPLTGLAFTDNLVPSGLIVSTPNALTGSCGGGTITATAGSSSISLSGATLAGGASCTFSLSLSPAAGFLAGSHINSTSPVTSNEAPPGAPATALLLAGKGAY